MKPPPFECVAVRTVEEAIAQLGDGGDDARVLAGGQSLVPMLNMRLARPATLVDVNPVTGLEAIEPGEALTLGALDGEVVAARADGERTIEASAFFLGPFTTALRPGELLTALRLPRSAERPFGFAEIARRRGDFALAGAAVCLAPARVVLFGLGAVPARRPEAEAGARRGGGRARGRRPVARRRPAPFLDSPDAGRARGKEDA